MTDQDQSGGLLATLTSATGFISDAKKTLSDVKMIVKDVKEISGVKADQANIQLIEQLQKKVKALENEVIKVENNMLKTQIESTKVLKRLEDFEDWKAEKARYQPVTFPTGQMAYILTKQAEMENPVYFCASCMDNEKRTEQMRITQHKRLACSHCNQWFETVVRKEKTMGEIYGELNKGARLQHGPGAKHR